MAHPVGLFGVWDFFEILSRPPFRTSPIGALDEPTNLAFHFRNTLQLLFHHLDEFQQKYMSFETFLAQDGFAGPNPKLFFDIQVEANAAAQGILSTLNILLDDVARIIPFVLFPNPANSFKPKQGFLQFKKHIIKKYPQASVVTNLNALFAELDGSSSWFSLALDHGIGMRQRLNHYTDMVILQASTPPGEDKVQPQFLLSSIGTSDSIFDFPIELKNTLHGLCDWLDRLDSLLTQHLLWRVKEESLEWRPRQECPGYSLPIVGTAAGRTFPENDYLYLPLLAPP